MAVNKIPESQLPLRSVSDSDSVRVVGADGKSYRVPKTDFNGGGGGGTVDPSLSPTSTNAVQNKAIYSALSGLRSDLGDLDDLETTDKSSIVAAINEARQSGGGGGSVTVDSALSTTSTNPVQNKVITTALNGKADNSAIPTKTSDLTNDSGFITSAPVTSVNGQTGAVTGLQTTANLVTSVSASSTDSQYPSAKLLYDTVGNIETLLAAI